MIILQLLLLYLVLGFLFALAFVTKGVSAIDESAKGMGIFVRIMLIPASLLLWPLLLKKWITVQVSSGGDA